MRLYIHVDAVNSNFVAFSDRDAGDLETGLHEAMEIECLSNMSQRSICTPQDILFHVPGLLRSRTQKHKSALSQDSIEIDNLRVEVGAALVEPIEMVHDHSAGDRFSGQATKDT